MKASLSLILSAHHLKPLKIVIETVKVKPLNESNSVVVVINFPVIKNTLKCNINLFLLFLNKNKISSPLIIIIIINLCTLKGNTKKIDINLDSIEDKITDKEPIKSQQDPFLNNIERFNVHLNIQRKSLICHQISLPLPISSSSSSSSSSLSSLLLSSNSPSPLSSPLSSSTLYCLTTNKSDYILIDKTSANLLLACLPDLEPSLTNYNYSYYNFRLTCYWLLLYLLVFKLFNQILSYNILLNFANSFNHKKSNNRIISRLIGATKKATTKSPITTLTEFNSTPKFEPTTKHINICSSVIINTLVTHKIIISFVNQSIVEKVKQNRQNQIGINRFFLHQS